MFFLKNIKMLRCWFSFQSALKTLNMSEIPLFFSKIKKITCESFSIYNSTWTCKSKITEFGNALSFRIKNIFRFNIAMNHPVLNMIF